MGYGGPSYAVDDTGKVYGSLDTSDYQDVGGEKSCEACTFLNPSYATTC